MIEATCTACGTANIFSDSDVAPGAKYALCESCKAKVVLPTKTALGSGLAAGPLAAPRPPGIPGLPGKSAIPPVPARPAIPSIPSIAGSNRPPPVPVKTPPAGGQAGDVIDLADLPAPKRQGGLAGAAPSRPAPTSGLAASLPMTQGADLPAPKRSSTGLAAAAPSLVASSMFDELPAPASPSRQENSVALDLDDLLAPVGVATGFGTSAPEVDDLLTPVVRQAPAEQARYENLPTPKVAGKYDDLPAPKVAGKYDDLPAPKGPSRGAALAPSTAPETQEITGLPSPKGFFDDLPMPAIGGGKGSIDLPAPKGFFDDLPQPSRGKNSSATDLPAPKGFFDDLPQPARGNSSASDLPAPLGFFDDLPQPSKTGVASEPKSGTENLPAPKRPASAAAAPAARSKKESLPGSLFDDIPLPSAANVVNKAASIDLDELDLALPSTSAASSAMGPISTPARSKPGAPMLDLGDASSANLDLGSARSSHSFGDLDLPMPTPITSPQMAERAAVKFAPGAKEPADINLSVTPDKSGKDLSLDIDGESARPRATPVKKAKAKAVDVAEKAKMSPRRVKIVAAAVLGVAVAGGGGVWFYRRHVAQQERNQSISDALTLANKKLQAGDPGHWKSASDAANRALELDETNADALGVVAEASFAGFLEDGTGGQSRLTVGKRALAKAASAAVNSPGLERARALQALAGDQAAQALPALQSLAKATPADASLALYVAWAQLELNQAANAVQTLAPIVSNPVRRAPALYARGRAYLALGDLTAARADFEKMLEIAKDHIGAQVGIAMSAPPTMAAQRETDLMSVLQRKDIEQADPRVVVKAWTLAGDDARRAGRLDTARDRYRNALAKAAADIGATVGLAETELRDNKLDLADELVTKVLKLDANQVMASIVAAEISLRRNKLDDTAKQIEALSARTPPIANPSELSRVQTLSGLLFQAQGRDDDALARLKDAITTAGDRDLGPTIAMVNLLGTMERKAQAAKDLTKANELRSIADQTLAPLATRADKEPELMLILGGAYINAGDPTKAEEWLRKAVTTRPTDVEAYFQLAEALHRLQREPESIEALRKAYDLDPSRVDIGVQLARTYERLDRSVDATKLYEELVKTKEPSIELRSRAGRFFAKQGEFAKAGEQGEEILKIDPENNASGFYLRGEGQLAAGKLDDARRALGRAVELERDPQYLDAAGRVAERLATKTLDTKYDDEALRSYTAANEKQPDLYNSLAGRGRILIKRHESVKALVPLLAANKLNPTDADVMFGIGVAYQDQSQTKAALAWLAKATNIKPTAEGSNRLGRLYLDADQAAPAAAALTDAVRLAKAVEKERGLPVPWLTDTMYVLGRVESDRRNSAAASRAWEDFLGRNPPNQVQVDEVKRYLANPH
jgi:tetratricopeptide (TPR) repeat protein